MEDRRGGDEGRDKKMTKLHNITVDITHQRVAGVVSSSYIILISPMDLDVSYFAFCTLHIGPLGSWS